MRVPSRVFVIGLLPEITHVTGRRISQKDWPPGLFLESRKHFVDHSDCSGSNENNEYAGKDEQNEGENEFDSGFGGFFLGNLPTAGPHGIALNAEGLADARSKAVGLDDDRGEGL